MILTTIVLLSPKSQILKTASTYLFAIPKNDDLIKASFPNSEPAKYKVFGVVHTIASPNIPSLRIYVILSHEN